MGGIISILKENDGVGVKIKKRRSLYKMNAVCRCEKFMVLEFVGFVKKTFVSFVLKECPRFF